LPFDLLMASCSAPHTTHVSKDGLAQTQFPLEHERPMLRPLYLDQPVHLAKISCFNVKVLFPFRAG